MVLEKIFNFYKTRIRSIGKQTSSSSEAEKPNEDLILKLLSLTDADNDVLITIAGIRHYSGAKPFREGKIVRLKKDRKNNYDDKAIMVVDNDLNTIGYVANSPNTIKDGTLGAEVIHGGIRNNCVARVMWVAEAFVICKLEGISCFDLVYSQGVRFCDDGEYGAALRLFLALEGKMPYSEVFKHIADCYIKQENFEKALPFVEKVLQKDAKDLQALMMRGVIYKALGRLEDAITDFTDINTIQTNYRVLLERCKCYMLQGDYESALCDATKVLRINPKSHTAEELKKEILKNRK